MEQIVEKENNEFCEKEWKVNPGVPARLLLLKKQLFNKE